MRLTRAHLPQRIAKKLGLTPAERTDPAQFQPAGRGCSNWLGDDVRSWLPGVSAAAVFVLLLAVSPASLAAAQSTSHGRFQLQSGAFRAGGFIPSKYTCSGDNVSPALTWSGAPAGTKSLVLIVADPDAPGGTWIHWVVYNLPASVQRLPEGVPKASAIEGGARQGTSSFQDIGYGGPCPPPGEPHHYHFKLYALNARLDVRAGATRGEVDQAMKGHILAQAELVGIYKR